MPAQFGSSSRDAEKLGLVFTEPLYLLGKLPPAIASQLFSGVALSVATVIEEERRRACVGGGKAPCLGPGDGGGCRLVAGRDRARVP